MIVVVKDSSGRQQRANIPGGKPLGDALSPYRESIQSVQINGRFNPNWEGFVGGNGNDDRVVIFVGTALPAIIGILISALINMALSALVNLLTPKPDKPNFNNRKEESSAIAGLHNAVETGTPRFYVLGEIAAVYGTVISTGVTVAPDGKSMRGRVLYLMSRTDGFGVDAIDNVIINDQPIENHPDIVVTTRLGTENQEVIPGFENVSQVFSDNRTFTPTQSIIYTTKIGNVNQIRAVIAFSSLVAFSSTGGQRENSCRVKVERKLTSDPVGAFVEVSGSPFRFSGKTRTPIYFPIEITVAGVGEGDDWDFRFTKATTGSGNNAPPDPQLFNVEEIQWTSRNYPNDALLALDNIPSADFPSLEQLKVSARVRGLLIPVPDGMGGFTRAFTRERVWIFRFLATNKALGLGARWEEDEFDDDWGIQEQAYYNEMVDGHDDVQEPRDLCDVIVNVRQDGLEWLKKICGEGRARFIPSGLKWRYVIDRPRTPLQLMSEPGNVIENSVVSEPLQPDPAINRVIVEYRDGDNSHLPNVIQLVDPDYEDGDPIVADAVKLDTVTRESQAAREGMYYRKKQALVRRHWQCSGAMSQLYAEPMDLVYFYYPTASHLRGYAGFVRGGSVGSVDLDQMIELENGETYQVVVQHRNPVEVETRTVDSAAGMRGRVTVSVDFTRAPVEGAVWSIDKVQVAQRTARIEDVVLSDDEPIKFVLSDYVPEVYNSDPLPSKSVRRFFDLARIAPLALRAALVTEEITQNRDGSHRSTLIFDVTPGFNNVAGLALAGGASSITLAATEPALADFYVSWSIEITEGPGAGEVKKIVAYDAARVATVDSPWDEQPDDTSGYKLYRERFGELTAFRVESSADGDAWVDLETFFGTRGEYRERFEGGQTFFRFTPISNGVENRLSRWVKSITTTGDLSAPANPSSVTLTSHFKNVTIDIFMQRPTAEDLAGFAVEYWRTQIGAPGVLIRTVQVPVAQDNAATGFMVRRHTESLSAEAYGTFIHARARSRDLSNNLSGFTTAPAAVELHEVTIDDIEEDAFTEFAEFANDASVNINNDTPVEVAGVTLATTGRPVFLLGKARFLNLEESGVDNKFLELRRGAAYAGSIDLDSSEEILLGDPKTPTLMKVDWPAPGTYTYKLWAKQGIGFGDLFSVNRRRLSALEIKDKNSA